MVLGLIEGLTEFVPVSSTAHVLLAGHFLGFEIARQHVCGAYPAGCNPGDPAASTLRKLLGIALSLPTSAREPSLRPVLILLGFLPAAVIGVIAHDFIKTVLFEIADAHLLSS